MDSFSIGQTGIGGGLMELSLAFGTGSGQANAWWHDQRSILTTANDDIDLAGGITSAFGETITFTVIKAIVITIVSPDGTKLLRVGPQNVANGWQGPYGGTGATVYETVYDWLIKVNHWAGWTVTGGTVDILRINNPSAVTVTYNIWIIGVA